MVDWAAAGDAYARAGWWGRRRIEFNVYLYLAFLCSLLGLTIAIEKLQAAWRFVHG